MVCNFDSFCNNESRERRTPIKNSSVIESLLPAPWSLGPGCCAAAGRAGTRRRERRLLPSLVSMLVSRISDL